MSEKKIQNQINYEIYEINRKINKTIIKLFEEILFGKNSNEHFPEESEKLIFEIQNETKNKYNDLYIKAEKDIIKEFESQIKKEKKSLHDKEKNEFWFGINDLNEKGFEDDFKLVEEEFKRKNVAFKYSMIKSIEELYNILEENVPEIFGEKIKEIISNENLKKKLEDKIKIIKNSKKK